MAFCMNCGKDIGTGSTPCDACGQKRPSAVAPLVGGIIVGATLVFMGSALVGGDTSRPQAPATATEPVTAPVTPAAQAPAVEAPKPLPSPPSTPPPAPEPTVGKQWLYTSAEDPMSSKKTYWAAVRSSNQIELDFPYRGAQRATLTLRTHPRHGKDVIFSIEQGQLLCPSYEGCNVLVRFDEDPAVRYSANGPADNSSETLFLGNYGGFAEKMMRAKRVRIAAEIYQAGAPVFEFDVSGFDVKKYRPE
jgi:hypothetical protein